LESDLKASHKSGAKDAAPNKSGKIDGGIKELQPRIAACPPDVKKGFEKSLNNIKF